jgi:hypothetical protein
MPHRKRSKIPRPSARTLFCRAWPNMGLGAEDVQSREDRKGKATPAFNLTCSSDGSSTRTRKPKKPRLSQFWCSPLGCGVLQGAIPC